MLRAALELADREGIDALSMRRLAAGLGVVPMAIYKHVANKDELLDGMIDIILATVDRPGPTSPGSPQYVIGSSPRGGCCSAIRGPHGHGVPPRPTLTVLAYFDSMIAMFTRGGFSIDLTHHVMHAMGSRLMGFSQELFNDQLERCAPGMQPEMLEPPGYGLPPRSTELYLAVTHDDASVVGPRL